MKYEVTIGIPVYKSALYIRRALMSALNQTYPSIEFLIVDDCGKDGSVAIIREIADVHPRGKDIRIISNAQNMGVAASRNVIIEEAQGVFLYFMDSDDTIADNTIELLMGGIRQGDAEIPNKQQNNEKTFIHMGSDFGNYRGQCSKLSLRCKQRWRCKRR